MIDPRLWSAAPAVLGVLGLLFLVVGLRQMLRGRVVLSLTVALGGAALAGLGLAVGLIGANALTYNRLTYERPIAEVSIRGLDPSDKKYSVTVTPISALPTTCIVQGDEWLLSAKVQTWKPWLNLLGVDATYTLDQLANKYADAAEANGKPITACELTGADPAFARALPQRFLAWLTANLQVEARTFGAANFMPLADGALYRVIMTQQGPAAEPANAAAQAAVAALRNP